jgi:hypothetical protein
MQKGFNSDIEFRGKTYHIQTEDWGLANPFLVSRVFSGGAVLKTVKTPYDEALKNESLRNVDAVQAALKKQHNRICDLVFQGQLSNSPSSAWG